MKTEFLLRNLQIPFILLVMLLNGCVTLNSFPNSARSGDTITLALGSPDGLDKDTLIVHYYSDSDPTNPIDISSGIRALFKIYPDHTSYAWLVSDANIIGQRGGHGPWTSVLAIDLPLGLPVGNGHVEITSNAGAEFPRFSTRPDNIDIALEILPGTGIPNSFEYATFSNATENGNLRRLQGRPQAVVKPPVLPEGDAFLNSYGAVILDLNIPITATDESTVLDEGIAVVLDPQPEHVFTQTQLFWSRAGDDFRINLVSPTGLYQHQIRLSVVPLFPNYPYRITGTPTLTSIQYFDINGAPASGEIPHIIVE